MTKFTQLKLILQSGGAVCILGNLIFMYIKLINRLSHFCSLESLLLMLLLLLLSSDNYPMSKYTQIGTPNIHGTISWTSNDFRHYFGFSNIK